MATSFVFENAGIRREAIDAWLKLQEAQDEHETYPCKDNPYFYTDYSDQNEQRVVSGDEAEKLCYGCPLIKVCYDFANANKEEYGIWGGINFGINEDHLW